jgi:hypothetical protein
MESSMPRAHSRSNATRLLSAGAYLEKGFRKRVIDELVTHRYRMVAPSYGYDAVTVLGHALAARSLHRKQIAAAIAGGFLLFLLNAQGVVGFSGAVMLVILLLSTLAFLRRAATLKALITRIRPIGEPAAAGVRLPGAAHKNRPSFPANKALTPDLVEKIAREQAAARDVIFYGGYRPFVGAGAPLRDWSTAVLLIGCQPNPILKYLNRDRTGREPQVQESEAGGVPIPFTVEEIMTYVGKRLAADLRDHAAPGERIDLLTVERQRYSRAGVVPIKRRRWRPSLLLDPRVRSWEADTEVIASVKDRERYGATREYLCIRVGSWDQELVTTMFVGFDLRGNTFYSEFYPHLLTPVTTSFHLVDQLPNQLTGGLLARVAWDVLVSFPVTATRTTIRWVGKLLSLLLGRNAAAVVGAVLNTGAANVPSQVAPVDTSEFQLGRYAVDLVDTGAVSSLRELAAASDFHHFFQEADTVKYVKVVERRLLQIIRDFLKEHNVDLADYDARQTTILDNSTSYGDATIYGNGNINQGGRQSVRQGAPSGTGGL